MSYEKDKYLVSFEAAKVECSLEVTGKSPEEVRERIIENLIESRHGLLFESHSLIETDRAERAIKKGKITKLRIVKKD